MGTTTPGLDRSTRLALNQVGGVRGQIVFGDRFNLTAFDESTVWNGPEDIYTFTDPVLDRINRISSDNVLDTGQVRIVGLDENWVESIQLVTLDGQNKVNLNPELIRLNYAEAVGVDLTGDVYIYEDTAITSGIPDDTTKVRGYISYEDNTTRQAVYSVPLGKKLVFRSIFYGSIPSQVCCTRFYSIYREFGDAFKRTLLVPLVSGGTTALLAVPKTDFSFTEKTDYYINIFASSPGSGVTLVIDLELITV